ncbi:homoserine dehydrogenase [Bacillus sp. sid0103]|uniref:homoserine dehydrogenase n=1 Tax=Bacillus sp. sid0103 TaxID=2856337 RepID=UPI001C436A33|nr:homoserine dehydrogenase [Bacillus sp. sid0103]MBV7506419.1 homoserine dehydrogenase [Bacillus sp. sid0103]
MSVIKVAILGFGTVGEGVYRTMQSHAQELEGVLGKKVEVAGVLIRNKQKKRNIDEDVLVTSDFNEILRLPQLDVIVEAIVNKEPTFTFLKQAIQRGCHIITANKEMFAHHGKELIALAEHHNVSIGYEATVAGGVPVIQTLRQLLNVNRVRHVQGILNGTSNFILTEMREKKQSFADALSLAQAKGFAEADPTNDVEGFDAFYKTLILSRIAFGEEPTWEDVEREGITSITSELIEATEKLGLRFKHVASISRLGGQINAAVRPALVGKSHPFFSIEGVENAVNVQTDIVGSITLQGPGAGMFPTASAAIEDLVYVCQKKPTNKNFTKMPAIHLGDKKEHVDELWLIQGLTKDYKNPLITWIAQSSDETAIIRTTMEVIKQLISEQNVRCCFEILGEYEIESNNKEVTLAAI